MLINKLALPSMHGLWEAERDLVESCIPPKSARWALGLAHPFSARSQGHENCEVQETGPVGGILGKEESWGYTHSWTGCTTLQSLSQYGRAGRDAQAGAG